MKKSKMKALVASMLSAVMVFSSGGGASLAYGQTSRGQLENSSEFKTDLRTGQKGLEPGFTISPDINTSSNEIISVIVELKEEPIAVNKATGKRNSDTKIQQEHESFKQNLKGPKAVLAENGDAADIEIGNEFFYAFNGMAMKVPANKLPEIAELPEVKRIWNNKEVKLPESDMPQLMAGPEDGITQIGVDKLHDENITGEGIKVGVLDTGIDYHHPQLKDVYKGGYDFVSNDNDPMETTYEDWKVANEIFGYPEQNQGVYYYTSHGTHVSGTIAANGEAGKAKGVAPKVDIYAYKVLGEYGSGMNDWIIAGIDKAVQDGMDVINLSLGTNVNDPLAPTSVAVNNAAKAGVIPVVAAGNAGPNQFTVAAPGTSPLAITVGASDTNLTIPVFSGNISAEDIAIKLFANSYDYDLATLKDKTLEMVFCGLGKSEDFENEDVQGKIAVIQRGEITFVEKIANAKAAGAEVIFIYNNVEDYINAYLEEDFEFIPTFNLTKADGEKLVENIEANKEFKFNEISSAIEKGDKLAEFSSRGPVASSNEIKPDVVAPGVNIYSTYPEFINHKEEGEDYSKAYAKISGTSMATPHVAGVVALMLQEARAKGETMSVEDVKVALMNTSEELNGNYNVYEKGAGRVNAYEAVKASVEFKINNKSKTVDNDAVVEIDNLSGAINFGNIYKGDLKGNTNKTITIVNNSKEDKEFNLSVYNSTPEGMINDSFKNGVKLQMAESIQVKAGQTIEVPVELIIPEVAEYGFYEGVLKFENPSNGKEDYLIPYAVNYVEKGIKQFNLVRNAMADEVNSAHLAFYPYAEFFIAINSPMEYQRLYLKDAATGKRIGLISEYSVTGINPGMMYFAAGAFNGQYMPMIGDYVENRFKLAGEGHYKLELELTDKDGNIYSAEEDLIIDNTPPVVTFEKEPAIYPVGEGDYTIEDEVKAFYLKGNIYDDTIDKLNQLGYTTDIFGTPINQQLNKVKFAYYKPNEYTGWTDFEADLDENGNFKIGIEPEDIAEAPLELRFNSYDYATAHAGNENMTLFEFYKEGTTYGSITYNDEGKRIKAGDDLEAYLNVAGMNNVTELNFEFSYMKFLYEVESVNINPDFESIANEKGYEVELNTSIYEEEWDSRKSYEVSVKLTGKGEGIDISDLTSIVDIKAKVIAGIPGITSSSFFVNYEDGNSKNKFKDKDGVETKFYLMCRDTFKTRPTTTEVDLSFTGAEGFYDENLQMNYALGFDEMGTQVYVIDSKGDRHDLTVNRNGSVREEIPASLGEGTLYVEVPGHFKNYTKIRLGKELDNDLMGIYSSVFVFTAFAGDMNGDNIIDNKDEAIIKADMGKTTAEGETYLASDINKDRVVDDKDLAFVNKNFGMVNPRLVEDAEVSVATLKLSLGLTDLQNALDKVNLLPESDKKQELLDVINEIAAPIYLGIATEAVEKAEASKAQGDVDAAKALVDGLAESEAKKELLGRLNAVQEAINNAIALETATKAVEKAEQFKTQADVDAAKALVDALVESEAKTELLARLNAVQEAINSATALERATKAVEKAEATKVQGDVDTAWALVKALPKSEAKKALEGRLNKVQEAINLAKAIEAATKAVEKAEKTKNKEDIKAAEKLVKALPQCKERTELLERLKKLAKDLPQTGAAVGTVGMFALGGLVAAAGVVMYSKKKED